MSYRFPENPNEYIDQKKILAYLPHRFPFLLVDRILEVTGPNPLTDLDPKSKIGIKVVGLKNVTINEPLFPGHCPETPVMPGVLILETMAQMASFSLYPLNQKGGLTGESGFQTVLVGVDDARFRVPVVPGDVLRVEAVVTQCRKTLWTYDCRAYVQDKLVAEAKILANLIPFSQKRVF